MATTRVVLDTSTERDSTRSSNDSRYSRRIDAKVSAYADASTDTVAPSHTSTSNSKHKKLFHVKQFVCKDKTNHFGWLYLALPEGFEPPFYP